MGAAANALEKSIRMECLIDPELPRALRGDPVRLRQILFNLCSNAIKFTHSTPQTEGQVHICIEQLSQQDSVSRVRLTVSDNGIGMSEDAIQTLFEPFRQGEAATTRQYGGTGLGLSICKHLVDLMDGQLHCASSPGAGAEFTITLDLPISQQWQRPEDLGEPVRLAAQPPQLPLIEGRAPRILVAEDNITNREVVSMQLTHLGAESVVVNNGQQALETWRREAFDLILTDCQMPVLDGTGLARAIRREQAPDTAPPPIIALTANALPTEHEHCLAAGMNGYLLKPTNLGRLHQTLSRWLASTPQATPAQRLQPAAAPLERPAAAPARLVNIVGPNLALHARLVRCFLKETPRKLTQISQALEQGGTEMAAMLAHSLQSSAKTLGADTLADHCQTMQTGCQSDLGTSAVPLSLDGLQQEYIHVEQCLENWLAEQQ